MADIILKDKYGNEVKHAGITQIEIPSLNTAGEVVPIRFTSLLNTRAYAIERNGSSDGVACYKVLDSLMWIPTQYCLMFEVTEDDCQSYGGDSVICFVTTKSLTIGETYKATDMY